MTAGISVFVTQIGANIADQTLPVLVGPGSASSVAVGLIEMHREEQDPWFRCQGSAPSSSARKMSV